MRVFLKRSKKKGKKKERLSFAAFFRYDFLPFFPSFPFKGADPDTILYYIFVINLIAVLIVPCYLLPSPHHGRGGRSRLARGRFCFWFFYETCINLIIIFESLYFNMALLNCANI